MLAEILREAGLEPADDVQLVRIPVDEHPNAWHRHAADAFITYEPVASQLLARGLVRLFDTARFPTPSWTCWRFAVTPWMRNMPRPSGTCWRRIFRRLIRMIRNPQDAAYRHVRAAGLASAEVLQAFKGIVLPTLPGQPPLAQWRTAQLLPTARRVAEILQRGAGVPSADDLAGPGQRQLPAD